MLNRLLKSFYLIVKDEETKISKIIFLSLNLWLTFIIFYPYSTVSLGTFNIFHGIPRIVIELIILVITLWSILSPISKNLWVKQFSALMNTSLYLWIAFSYLGANLASVGGGTYLCLAMGSAKLYFRLLVQEEKK